MPGRHAARPRVRPRPYLLAGLAALVAILVARFLPGEIPLPGLGGRCHALTVASSPETAPLLGQLAREYLDTARPEVGGRCVAITVNAVAPRAALTALTQGWGPRAPGPRPDVWVPPATTWVRLLAARQAPGEGGLVPRDTPPLALSPLVLAMPRPLAEELGWPAQQPSRSDLLRLLLEKDGWAELGRPELGEVKLAVPDVFLDTAGLHTFLAHLYLAASEARGQGTPLSRAVLADSAVREAARRYERAVDERPGSTAELLENLRKAGGEGKSAGHAYASVLALEEQAVLAHNRGGAAMPAAATQQPAAGPPLAAIYPAEGTLVSDHPWVVLNAPWVDQAKRDAAAGFLAYLQGGQAQGRFQQAGFRSSRGEPGSVINGDNGVLPVQPRVLPPPDPGTATAALDLYLRLSRPGSVLLVIDVSQGMTASVGGRPLLETVRDAVLASLGSLDPQGELGVWVFSSQLDGTRDYLEVVPFGPLGEPLEAGSDRREFTRLRVAALEPTPGGGALYDSVWAAWEYMGRRASPDRPGTVVVLSGTRNSDPAGGLSLDALLARLREQAGGALRVVTVGLPGADTAALQAIAQASGGTYLPALDPEDIPAVVSGAIGGR